MTYEVRSKSLAVQFTSKKKFSCTNCHQKKSLGRV